MVFNLIAQVLIAIAINVVAYVLQPKPKTTKPEAAKDMDGPTSEAGRPVPVVFGTITVKGLNCLGWWDKETVTAEIDT